MKKMIMAATAAFYSLAAMAQADKIVMHNGATITGKVIKVAEHTVVFTYENEDAEQTQGKYAVARIVYGKSGREQKVTDKISVRSKDDWNNVIILESRDAVAGLSREAEIKGKTSFMNMRTAGGSDRKAEEYLKKEAAARGCAFVLLTSDKDIDRKSDEGGGFGQIQSIKKGIAYKY